MTKVTEIAQQLNQVTDAYIIIAPIDEPLKQQIPIAKFMQDQKINYALSITQLQLIHETKIFAQLFEVLTTIPARS